MSEGRAFVAQVVVQLLEIGGSKESEVLLLLHALGEVQSVLSTAPMPVRFSFQATFDAHWPIVALRHFLMAELLKIQILKPRNQQVADFQLRPWCWLKESDISGAVCLQHTLGDGKESIWIRLQVDASVAEDPEKFGLLPTESLVKVPEKGEIICIPESQLEETLKLDSELSELDLLHQALVDLCGETSATETYKFHTRAGDVRAVAW